MIILRQKQFGWFGFGKKKQPEYKCPKFSDLPINLQRSLREVEKVWEKPETQRLLGLLGKELKFYDTPFKPYLNQKHADHVYHEILIPPMSAESYPDSTLIYPLMWNVSDWLLCFDITNKKFLKVFYHDNKNLFDVEKDYWNLKDYIKDSLNEYDYTFCKSLSESEFYELIGKIKKAFGI